MNLEGTCLEPHIPNGTAVVCDKNEKVNSGDFVILFFRSERVAPGAHAALCKRLVLGLPPFVKLPWHDKPGSDDPVIIVAMLNPPQHISYRWRDLLAIHKVLGTVPEDAVYDAKERRYYFPSADAEKCTALTASASKPDAQLLAWEAEIDGLYEAAHQITRERVDPHNEEFIKLAGSYQAPVRAEALRRFDKKSGRSAAIAEADKFLDKADKLTRKMWALPATSSAGRVAKARVFFKHIALEHFHGPDSELDWDMSLARQLLLEYAGLTEADAVKLTSENR
jgi:hypothetical protein